MKHLIGYFLIPFLTVSPLWAQIKTPEAETIRILLQSGNELSGRMLKQTEEKVWIDLGYDVLEIPRTRIRTIQAFAVDDENGENTEEANFEERLWASRNAQQTKTVEAWVEQLGEGVVEIRSRSGQGSGFIINPQGMVITNHHVIAGDRELTATVFRNTPQGLKRVQYKNIRIVALDPARDLALLSIEDELEAPLKWLPIAEDSGGIQTGETVFAIGSPLGLDRTVSRGIVSLSDRLVNGRLFLQTTAEINPGNSGGPLFNLQGEVVGVNTLKFMQTGIEGFGFSIPSESVKLFVNKRNAFAFDPRNPNTGYHYLNPPRKPETPSELSQQENP